ncbi:MAG: zinc ribbon domain-containing protein [Candidatus Omnitrophica bacterium]|nr:zinc ribbon domain-containing protein [Candidatus Omnitrophota bacterium]
MPARRYVCTHCGRKFEAEERETLECPGCFWSSTVKREEDVPASAKAASLSPLETSQEKPAFKMSFPPGLLKILAVLTVMVLTLPFAGKVVERFQQEIELSRQNRKKQIAVKGPASALSENSLPVLSEEDQAVLNRVIHIDENRALSDSESEILKVRVPFHTGISENLPSQVWTLENFKEMIKEQERFYKVPLPGSYKGKLEKLFEEKYLLAEEAFRSGDLVKARNLWVEALALPQYSKDLSRHRGVALTMLRPFINDTLSKIGAINSSLVEKNIREKEKKLSESYAQMAKLIDAKSWQEASAQILEIEKLIQELENPRLAAGQAPAYPSEFAKVDDGIKATLAEMLSPAPPAVADLAPMKQDIQTKRKVVESFQPEVLEASAALYEEALDLIREGNPEGAIKKLKQIESPLALAEDAKEKVEILKKYERNQPAAK